jgi:PAS domain S-box-containing protein
MLVHELDHAMVLQTEHQRAALQSTLAQVHLTEQLTQREAVIREQQKQLDDLQQRVHDMQEEVIASRTAALQHRVEVSNAIEELQITAEELETTNHALHMANERFVMVLSCAQAGTWDWDMTGNQAAWSQEYFELHGLRPEAQEPSYQTWYDAVHSADRLRVERSIQDWLERRENEIDLEYRIHHPDKGLRWLVLRGRILYDQCGQACRMLGMTIDITERKRAEAEARRAQVEAERANSAKSRFLAAASHDLRQPIQAATLFLSLLERRELDPPTHNLVSRLADAVGGVQGMLEGLLDLARLEACIVVPDVRDMALDDLLQQLATEFGGIAEAAGLWLRVPRTSMVITSDALLLGQILRNLVANGLKYTVRGGATIECREVEGMVRISVIDTGHGIPAEQLKAIFEEFHQLDNPARDRVRGFGLGLAIVEQAARRLGHHISVQSEPGRGSTFSVDVPLGQSAAPAPAPVRADYLEQDDHLTGQTVLVVEDDPAIQLALDMLLRDWGLKVHLASSVEEVEAVLNGFQSPPDIMLADYRLPAGRSGTEAVELARRKWPIPAVLVTGDTDPQRLAEAQRSGCRLLHKPVDPIALRQALLDCLR